MVNVDLIELIIDSKENEIQDLLNTLPINQSEVDLLTEEILYLKVKIARYKIAKLLGLDNDPRYTSIGFLGIEEENVADFNLSPSDMTEYNFLISQIPSEQLQRYKVRREMANVLGEDIGNEFKDKDYEGIESINPNLTKYGLSQEQINDFNSLLVSLNAIGSDTTRRVDVDKETIKMFKEAFDKLNIDDLDEYNRIKDAYLDTMDKLISAVDENEKKALLGSISNYELAAELKEKYPAEKVKLDITGVQRLLTELENPNLDPDKYDEYIELLSSNVNSLYSDDANKPVLETIISGISTNNYTLRSDLHSRLGKMNNVDLGLKDNELEGFVSFLDQNYDVLEERERDKYYNLINSKLSKDLDDLEKVDEANNVLLQVQNKNLSGRLQSSLSGKQMAKFSDRHLSSYDSLREERISELKKKKREYESKKPLSIGKSAAYDIKIREIDKEIAQLENAHVDNENNSILEGLDSKYNDKTDKIIALKKEIAQLKELKKQINSEFHKKIIDRQINAKNRKIARLQYARVMIVGTQKKVMTPKLWLEQKKGAINRHFESKKDVYKDYSDNYRMMADTERQLNGMFSSLKAKFYDYQAKKYNKKAEFNQKICDTLRNAKVAINGYNQQRINRNTLNSIRRNQQQQLQQNQNQQQLVQTA